MKNRRIVLVAFLLCASILVGVGYAAVITTLNVDGKASFTPGDSHAYAEEIHFTGVSRVVDYQHNEITDQSAIIAAAQSGDQRAVLSASFTGSNRIPFVDNNENYTAGVVYVIAVVCPEGAESITVTFADAPQVSGNVDSDDVNTSTSFVVTSHLKLENGEEGDDVKEITVNEGGEVKLELHVRLEMSGDVTDAIPDTDFEVILPVTGVTITEATT